MAAGINLAQAQVRKCIGTDGKVTYSDFVCGKNTANEAGVRTDANTIDSSGLRREAEGIRADRLSEAKNIRADRLRAEAIQGGSKKCSFEYYSIGDTKGKELAEAATKECYANLVAKETGGTTSLEAYNMWKDHHGMVANKRNAAGSRSMYCRPNGSGTMLCN